MVVHVREKETIGYVKPTRQDEQLGVRHLEKLIIAVFILVGNLCHLLFIIIGHRTRYPVVQLVSRRVSHVMPENEEAALLVGLHQSAA